MKRLSWLLLLSLFVAPAFVTSAAPQTADEVIEKHIAALGGREALMKLTSRKGTGTMTVQTPNGSLSGPVEVYSKVPNKTRLYVVLDLSALGVNEKMTLDQKFDGTAAWQLNTLQGDRQITGNQLDNMKNAAFPNALLNYKASGATAELLPNETVGGTSLLVLRLTPKAGSVSKLYLDPATFLVVRTTATVDAADGSGKVESVSEVSDYRTVDGVKIPFRTVQTSGPQTATIVLDKVEHNVTIDDSIFSVK